MKHTKTPFSGYCVGAVVVVAVVVEAVKETRKNCLKLKQKQSALASHKSDNQNCSIFEVLWERFPMEI